MFSKTRISAQFVELFNQTMKHQLKEGVFAELMAKYTPMGCPKLTP
jgi:ABC-type amino acid transport substrate-binding protein